MMKFSAKYLPVLITALLWSSAARADIEGMQVPLGVAKGVYEEGRAIQEQYNQIKEEVRSTVEGVAGPVKSGIKAAKDAKAAVDEKIDAAKNMANDPEGSLETLNKKMPNFLNVDGNDQEKLTEAVNKNFLPQIKEGENQTEVVQKQNEKMEEIIRDQVADLYSSAFAIRTNLATEKASELDMKDSREIITATRDKAVETARRLRKIMLMETLIYMHKTTKRASIYMNQVDSEEGAND